MSAKQSKTETRDDYDVEEGEVCDITKSASPVKSLPSFSFGTQLYNFFDCPSSILSVTGKTTLQLLETACLLICDSFPPKVGGSDDDGEDSAGGFFFDNICGGDVAPASRQQLEYSYDLEMRT